MPKHVDHSPATTHHAANKHAENGVDVAALLTFSGGFLDVFTYVGHGHVFANTMTGNIVFLGMFSAT